MPEQKKVIISHDYDGCFSIMTEEGLKGELNGANKACWEQFEKQEVNVAEMFRSIIAQHNDFLDEITKNASEVRVYVGSDRQSYNVDQHNLKIHNNGSVFPALENLCQRRSTSEQPWIFEHLLLADPEIKEGGPFLRMRGEAYKSIKEKAKEHLEVVVERITFKNHRGKLTNSKRPLLLNQMWDAHRQNPNAQLEFHFIDDRNDLIEDILKNLKPENLPPKMTLVVSKFNFLGVVERDPDAHKTCGTIKAIPTKSNCADKYPYLTWGLYAATAAAVGITSYTLAPTMAP